MANKKISELDDIRQGVDAGEHSPYIDDYIHLIDDTAVSPINKRGNFSDVLPIYISPKHFGAVGDGVADDTVAVQAFFDYITTNNVGTAECSGEFLISSGITIGHATTQSETLHISGNAKFTTATAIDIMVLFQNTSRLVWSGRIEVWGTGGSDPSYAGRTCRVGLQISDGTKATSALKISYVYCRGFYEYGVYCNNNSIFAHLGDCKFVDCGSGYSGANRSLTANWSNKVDSGADSSVTQRSTIDVDTLPTATVVGRKYVIINGQPYYIYSVDDINDTITIYPWLDQAETSGTLRYLFGAGIYAEGGDAGIIGIDSVDAIRCGFGAYDGALYGMNFDRLVVQSCGVGYGFGSTPDSTNKGGTVRGFYTEGNDIDFLFGTRDVTGKVIMGEYIIDLNEIKYTAWPKRLADDAIVQAMEGLSFFYNGNMYEHHHLPNNENDVDSGIFQLDVFDPQHQQQLINADIYTFSLQSTNQDINTHFGLDSCQAVVIGTNSDGSPSGTITFNPPVTYTVNGGSSDTFTGFSGPAIFMVKLDIATSDFLVSSPNQFPVESVLANSATPSVAGKRTVTTGGSTPITDFTGGIIGQELIILSDHAITITDGTNIHLNGSSNFIMAIYDSLTLIKKSDGRWYETARMVN